MTEAHAQQVSFKRASSALALLVCCFNASPAFAEETALRDQLEQKPSSASAASDDGAFMPLSPAAAHHSKAQAKLLSGYDSATKSGLFRGEADARVTGPLGLRAGVSYDGAGKATRPFAGGYFDLLQQNKHGISLSLRGGFESRSFNQVPEVTAGFALSHDFSGSLLLANAEYGNGLQGNERNAAAGLAFLQRLNDHFRLGVDSRFQIDLERDLDEPPGELDWRSVGGPLLLANLGPVAATLGGGVSALHYRFATTTLVGATAYAGLGAAF